MSKEPKIVILDTETTGKTDPEPIEVAYLEIDYPSLETLVQYKRRFKPSKEIELGAMATHHIIPEDLEDCAPSGSFKLVDLEVDYLIGHNIDYDWNVLGSPEIKRIDTLALARKYLPHLDSHTQSALLYFILDKKQAREMLKNAHSALADVLVCKIILTYLLKIINEAHDSEENPTIEELWKLSENARIPTIMPFGKHKGVEITELPLDYVRWCLRQVDFDPYLVKALKKRLNRG